MDTPPTQHRRRRVLTAMLVVGIMQLLLFNDVLATTSLWWLDVALMIILMPFFWLMLPLDFVLWSVGSSFIDTVVYDSIYLLVVAILSMLFYGGMSALYNPNTVSFQLQRK